MVKCLFQFTEILEVYLSELGGFTLFFHRHLVEPQIREMLNQDDFEVINNLKSNHNITEEEWVSIKNIYLLFL